MNAIIEISAYYYDSAAAIAVDGKIVVAAQEAWFTRKEYDTSFPVHALKYVLDESGITPDSISAVAFYEKPFLKFERLLETYHAFAPSGITSFLSAMPVWIKDKLFLKKQIQNELKNSGIHKSTILFPEHHLSHAASAFYPSPYNDAGGAVGAALCGWYLWLNNKRPVPSGKDAMLGSYLGPDFTRRELNGWLFLRMPMRNMLGIL